MGARGFTELLGVQRPDNADSIAALARSGFTRLGRLTRRRLLWRVSYSFVADGDATTPRISTRALAPAES